MQERPLAALDLPLKVLVWDDAGQTKISYIDPDTLARDTISLNTWRPAWPASSRSPMP
jgi:uncharacterized protein (DUF302 family)